MAKALGPDDRCELLRRLSGESAEGESWLEAAELRYRRWRHWQLGAEAAAFAEPDAVAEENFR